MRTLKKTLSLVLVLAMVMSLGVSAFAADAKKDYADYASVSDKHTEAVEVMTAVGVFNGVNGNFKPNDTLTREMAAKIVTYMLMEQKDADALTAIVAPYADVAADRWSAGAIAYCKNEGILAGVGDNMFNPEGVLTGLQFAKMLLCALGYDAETEKLTGDSWAVNAAKLAINNGLNTNLETVALAGDINREQAAQMGLNTFKAQMIEYPRKVDVNVGDVDISFGADATKVTSSNTKVLGAVNGTIYLEFAEKYQPKLELKDTATYNADDFGRPGKTWVFDKNDVRFVADDPVLEYHSELTGNTVSSLTKQGYTFAADFVYNGGNSTDVDTMAELYVNNTAAATGYNIEMYSKDDDKDIDTIVVYELYLAKVGAFTAAKGNNDASVKVDVYEHTAGKKTLTVTDNPNSDTDIYDAIAKYSKDDYIGVYAKPGWDADVSKGADNIIGVEDLTTASGTVTRVTAAAKICTSSIALDGTAYRTNSEFYDLTAGAASISSASVGDEGTLYLDKHGNALAYEKVKGDTNYAVVIGVGNTNSYGDGASGATLLLADGTQVAVTYKLSTGTTITDTGAAGYNGVPNDVKDPIGDLVTYTVGSDGVYTLTKVSNGKWATTDAGDSRTTNGKSEVKIGSTTKYATSDTIFFVATGAVDTENSTKATMTYKVYKGYANVPTISGGVIGYGYAVKSTNTDVLEAVYLTPTSVSGSGSAVYILRPATAPAVQHEKNVKPYVELPAVVNGELTTLKVDATESGTYAYEGMFGTAGKGYVVASYVTDSDDIITSVTLKQSSSSTAGGYDAHFYGDQSTLKGTVAANGTVIGLDSQGTVKYYAYDNATALVVVVAEDGESMEISTVESLSTDTNDEVQYILDSNDKTVTAIYVAAKA